MADEDKKARMRYREGFAFSARGAFTINKTFIEFHVDTSRLTSGGVTVNGEIVQHRMYAKDVLQALILALEEAGVDCEFKYERFG